GPAVIELLLANGIIRGALDLFAVQKEQLLPLPRFGERSAEKLVANIATSRQAELARVIDALGIPQVGHETAQLLAGALGSLSRLAEAGEAEITNLEGIGPSMSASILGYFADSDNRAFVDGLVALGLGRSPQTTTTSPSDDRLHGLSFVITGALSQPRRYYEELIEQAGGRVAEAVSVKINYLLCGEAPGSKLAKAQKLGVPVLDEAGFLELSGQPPPRDAGGNRSDCCQRVEPIESSE
ncbi:MAG TPA: helix-hairpin-helix domain-containing protein, partial [Chloroflexota bacterium]|nr:helix-hairpin-helix domain-containing protein [Chloroflexota bacterium]